MDKKRKKDRFNKKLPIKEEKEKEDEDYDFDFSIYEQEESEEDVVETIINRERPVITGLKSRFSPGQLQLERLMELCTDASKYSILVETRVQKMAILWKFYGILSEIWEIIRNIFGKSVNDEITALRRNCRTLMSTYQSGEIPPKVHNNLLFLRSNIYRLQQLSNLGFEVDKVNRSGFRQTKTKIIE